MYQISYFFGLFWKRGKVTLRKLAVFLEIIFLANIAKHAAATKCQTPIKTLALEEVSVHLRMSVPFAVALSNLDSANHLKP